jgi:hypothetical protein
MADTNITELRPSPAKGEGLSRNALRQRRFRKKRKSVTRNAAVTPKIAKQSEAITPIPHRGGHIADLAAYVAAIALAGAAAWFSIRGMTVLFPGAPLAVIAMSATMEGAKLVTAGWLARR